MTTTVVTIVTIVAVVVGLALAALTGIAALRNRPVDRVALAGSVVVELSVLAYDGVRVVGLAQGHHPSSTGLTVAYLIGIALVMPIAVALALAEGTRWGSVVLGVGALTVCVLYARIAQVWRPHG